MKKLSYVQLEPASGELLTVAEAIWRRFITEVNENDGIFESDDDISSGFAKRVAIQGSRSDMHFELVFDNDTAVGIAMFAVDTGTVYGLLERGLGTVMGFYVCPEYRRRGIGTAIWNHAEAVLLADGAVGFYVVPDLVTGVPFWESLGFENSGILDPDDKKLIYVKKK